MQMPMQMSMFLSVFSIYLEHEKLLKNKQNINYPPPKNILIHVQTYIYIYDFKYIRRFICSFFLKKTEFPNL